jgi:glycosyltransferase involved in cell wall biosynthesis
MLNCALNISTYNRPKALWLTLASVMQQTIKPTQVVIADDGSTNETKLVIDEFKAVLPITHIWHEDKGFRLAAIRNKGVAASTAPYIVQIDGDLILHHKFIEDHLQFAAIGSFVTGSRILINEVATQKLEDDKDINVKLYSSYTTNKTNGWHLPFLWKSFEKYDTKKEPARVRGCNMAFYKDDFIKVNGYNEAMEGWGSEDFELAARFLNSGLKKRSIKFGAIQFHLYHKESPRDNETKNRNMYLDAVAQRKTICEKGINQYL